jgi:hypothetical protein
VPWKYRTWYLPKGLWGTHTTRSKDPPPNHSWVDYDGEHHACMGNETHNLLIGGHESLPPSQGPWCLCGFYMLGLGITTMRCSILSHKAYTRWWSCSRCCDLATSCLAFFCGHFANSCVQCKLSHPRATIYILGVFSKLHKTKDICQTSQIYAKCLWQKKLSLFPFDHLVVEFDGLDA